MAQVNGRKPSVGVERPTMDLLGSDQFHVDKEGGHA